MLTSAYPAPTRVLRAIRPSPSPVSLKLAPTRAVRPPKASRAPPMVRQVSRSRRKMAAPAMVSRGLAAMKMAVLPAVVYLSAMFSRT
ncbi:hypothetical protein D3C86_1746420 [compost metagenome]